MSRLLDRRLVALVFAVAVVVLAPASASAGCLTEYNQCEGCAKKTMWEAMKGFDVLGIRQANLELWDCAIDLHHCVFFGQHHSSPCAL